MASPADSNILVLNSWKEIAQHVGRGVRTVQRWERDLGMPVRRPRAKSRSAVIALADEIDAWLRNAPTVELCTSNEPSQSLSQLQQAIAEHLELRDRCQQLRKANEQAIASLVANLKQIHQSIVDSRNNRDSNPLQELAAQTKELQREADELIHQH